MQPLVVLCHNELRKCYCLEDVLYSLDMLVLNTVIIECHEELGLTLNEYKFLC